MTQFPTPADAASWAGLCPGNNESAGRSLGGKVRKGNRHLRAALGEAAFAASHTKNTYLAESYRRLERRRGKPRAIVATARKILEAAWYVLTNDVDYRDLGPDYLARRINPDNAPADSSTNSKRSATTPPSHPPPPPDPQPAHHHLPLHHAASSAPPRPSRPSPIFD